MKPHHCPPWCHRCPDIIRAYHNGRRERNEPPGMPSRIETIMPGCDGTANNSECTCAPRRSRKNLRLRSVIERLDAIEAALLALAADAERRGEG